MGVLPLWSIVMFKDFVFGSGSQVISLIAFPVTGKFHSLITCAMNGISELAKFQAKLLANFWPVFKIIHNEKGTAWGLCILPSSAFDTVGTQCRGGGAVRRSCSIKTWLLILFKEEIKCLLLEGLFCVSHSFRLLLWVFFLILCNRASTHTSSTGGFPDGNNYVYGAVPWIRLSQFSHLNSKWLPSHAVFQA